MGDWIQNHSDEGLAHLATELQAMLDAGIADTLHRADVTTLLSLIGEEQMRRRARQIVAVFGE